MTIAYVRACKCLILFECSHVPNVPIFRSFKQLFDRRWCGLRCAIPGALAASRKNFSGPYIPKVGTLEHFNEINDLLGTLAFRLEHFNEINIVPDFRNFGPLVSP